ncbi:MAG: radical SAM protein [Candidatus Gribaldobacteria bacterium]|nr:radical SAM protein [Candidatus Gribaldobacteria bacterium]
MKRNWLIIAVSIMLIVSNFSVSVGYSLKIKNTDPSLQGLSLLFYPEENNPFNYICVLSGDTLVINQKISGIVHERFESSWVQYPVKAKAKIDISFKKNKEVGDRKVESLMLVFAIVRKDDSSLEKLSATVPVLFPGQFPDGYKNNVKGWGNISKDQLHSCLPDGTAKLFTMDFDKGNKCSLRCKHCFRRDDRVDSPCAKFLTHEKILGYVKEAKSLGLQEIKILGRGEPFEDSRFLEFLREVSDMGISIAVFTKGHVLGCDDLARKYNKQYGIKTGWELIQALKELNVSILLGFNSFNRLMQEKFVGVDKFSEKNLLKNYVAFRDQALTNLVKAGFNDYVEGEATRLAMIAAPCKPENIDEMLSMYQWGRVRNIYTLTCPTNICGKGVDEFEREKEFQDYILKLEDVWAQMYIWAIQKNLISLETFLEDGVSLYPGCHPCNQTAAGFYLHLSGQTNLCPGRKEIFCEDIRKVGLKKAWAESANYKRAKFGSKYNYHCVARDGYSLPLNFYQEIETKVLNALQS